jgi:hypothetical protein
MTQIRKKIRCYAEQEGDQWVAYCIDFSLAAQGSTFDEARDLLHKQIVSYVNEALTIDRDHMHELLNRRAPLAFVAKFHAYALWSKLFRRPVRRARPGRRLIVGKNRAYRENLSVAAC